MTSILNFWEVLCIVFGRMFNTQASQQLDAMVTAAANSGDIKLLLEAARCAHRQPTSVEITAVILQKAKDHSLSSLKRVAKELRGMENLTTDAYRAVLEAHKEKIDSISRSDTLEILNSVQHPEVNLAWVETQLNKASPSTFYIKEWRFGGTHDRPTLPQYLLDFEGLVLPKNCACMRTHFQKFLEAASLRRYDEIHYGALQQAAILLQSADLYLLWLSERLYKVGRIFAVYFVAENREPIIALLKMLLTTTYPAPQNLLEKSYAELLIALEELYCGPPDRWRDEFWAAVSRRLEAGELSRPFVCELIMSKHWCLWGNGSILTSQLPARHKVSTLCGVADELHPILEQKRAAEIEQLNNKVMSMSKKDVFWAIQLATENRKFMTDTTMSELRATCLVLGLFEQVSRVAKLQSKPLNKSELKLLTLGKQPAQA